MLAQNGGRVLSRVFWAWLIVGVLALPAGARYGGGLGTTEQPYLISTAAQLNELASMPSDWDKCFKLAADIDMRDAGPMSFARIGTPEDGPFIGVFDGNHKTISNLRLSSEDQGYLAMFGLIDTADVRIVNVTLLDPNVVGSAGRYMASLVAYSCDGTIANCHVRGGSICGTSFVGGLIARKVGGAAITDCTAATTVSGMSRIGGLIGGSFETDVTRCQAAGEVYGDELSWSVGGLIGENESGAITECRVCCSVQGGDRVGGLIGENLGYNGWANRCCTGGTVRGGSNVGGLIGLSRGTKATDCYTIAVVTGDTSVGGLVGYNDTSCNCPTVYRRSMISRCYAAGRVEGLVDVGGLVGVNSRSIVETSFWDIEASGCAMSDGGEGRTTSQMYSLVTYLNAGWDFSTEKDDGAPEIWRSPAPKEYPRLAWEPTWGDLDGDGRVDLRDYALLTGHWLQDDTVFWPAGPYGTSDPVVDFDDLTNLADLWLAHR